MSQLSKTSFGNLYGTPSGTTFPDNTTGDISEGDMRQFGKDILDSAMFLSDNFIDEDSFASDSATKVPSQQSVKAYVTAQTIASGFVDTAVRVFEDFFHAPQILSLQAFSSGDAPTISMVGHDTTEQALGVVALDTGTSATGGSAAANVTYWMTLGNGFTLTQLWRVSMSDLSDGTQTFLIKFGFMDTFSSAPTNGAYFRYTHGTNGGRWQAVTVLNSTETAEDTGIAAVADTFYTFKIIANSTASQVDFYINGTLTNDITTNIPNMSAGTEEVGYSAVIQKSVGTTARFAYVDYFELIATRTTAR